MDHSDSDSVSVSDPLIPCRADFHFLQHQEDGIRWMIQRDSDPVIPGGILADDMGLGKTCQSIGIDHFKIFLIDSLLLILKRLCMRRFLLGVLSDALFLMKVTLFAMENPLHAFLLL